MIYAIDAGADISIYVQPIKGMCHGVSCHIFSPHTQSFSTFQLPKSIKFANFKLIYEIIGFKDIQIMLNIAVNSYTGF